MIAVAVAAERTRVLVQEVPALLKAEREKVLAFADTWPFKVEADDDPHDDPYEQGYNAGRNAAAAKLVVLIAIARGRQ